MWIIECDGDLFQHKRKWLRPGKTYLFGRTKENCDYAINNKSVSRKHLLITVAPVKAGEGLHAHGRSEVTLQDESRLGTFLDGEKLVQSSRTLTKNVHEFKLGSYEVTFRVVWHPVVLCFSFPDKQQKKGSDILAPFQAKLESLDVKVILDFVFDKTTHVIASKRNTAKGLQALINGRYIVTEAFADAIVQAATAPNSDVPSSIEEDFDANWPNALDFLPGPGKEPSPRPAEFFAPDPDRLNIFEGYTFVISEQTQFDNLQPVLLSGAAKCVQFHLKFGETRLDEFVAFVKNVAGEKGIGEFEDGSQEPGVVVVRFRSKEAETFDWALRFIENADAALGQRSVEQNEFLDAILAIDAKRLRRPLEEAASQGTRAPPPTAVPTYAGDVAQELPKIKEPPPSAPQQEQPATPDPPKKRTRRIVAQSRFKGFDDFDASQLPKVRIDSSANDEGEGVQDLMVVDSQSLFVGASQASEEDTQPSRKRKAPLDSIAEDGKNDGEAMVDALLPAAAAMKKRRLEDAEEARRTGRPVPSISPMTPDSAKTGTFKKKEKPPLDIKTAARSHRQLLDDEAAREAEELAAAREADGDEDVSKLRDLAIIEEMEIPGLEDSSPSRPRTRLSDQQSKTDRVRRPDGQEWDDRWNGRKNFKRFRRNRRPGDPEDLDPSIAAIPSRKVIVTMVEVKRKDFGIGESYWLDEPSTTVARSKGSAKARDANVATQESRASSATMQEPAIIVESDAEGHLSDIIVDDPGDPTPATQRRHQQATASPASSKTGKRPARGKQAATPAPPAKRQRQTRQQSARDTTAEAEESDGDEMKFRFRRSRR